jgi:uridine kinase
MSNEISIEKWPIDNIQNKFAIAIFGPKRSGKTTLVKDILTKFDGSRNFKESKIICLEYLEESVHVINDSLLNYPEYKNNNIPVFDINALREMLDMVRRKQVNQISNNFLAYKMGLSSIKSLTLVLENMSKLGITTEPLFKELLLNKKKYNINIIIVEQFPLNLEPKLRNKLDHVITFKEKLFLNQLYKQYFTIFKKKIYLTKVLDSICKDNGTLVRNKSGIFWYRVDIDDIKNNYDHLSMNDMFV